MKGLNTGQKVNFMYRIAEIKGKKVIEYKKGIITQITTTGYDIQIVDDLSVKCMDGTICNRNEKDVEPIKAPKE